MLIAVFLNCPPLLSLGMCHYCLMLLFTFDVKGLADQRINADCCIIIFPPFPSLVVGGLMSPFLIDVRFRSTSLFLFDVVIRRD